MNKLNWHPKVLYRGICTSILDALCVMSIVAQDQIQKGSTGTLTQAKYGSVNSAGAPLTANDKALTHAFILDTEGDVFTKMDVVCNVCGNELEVIAVESRAEVAVILSVGVCDHCINDAHSTGYHKGITDATRGF